MNNTSMIMRVAKAINGPYIGVLPDGHDADRKDQIRDASWSMAGRDQRQNCVHQAIAVLNEMLNPTTAMIVACGDLPGSQQDYWKRSIDMALSDKDF